jgi:hypothetical protein
VENYRSPERFAAELEVFRRSAMLFCPSAALPEKGSYVAREAAGTPIVIGEAPTERSAPSATPAATAACNS